MSEERWKLLKLLAEISLDADHILAVFDDGDFDTALECVLSYAYTALEEEPTISEREGEWLNFLRRWRITDDCTRH